MPRPIVIQGSKKKADGDIYDDGTSIKNISVSGVAEKVAMFGQTNKTTPPVLRKMKERNAILENSSGQGTDKPPPWTVKSTSANSALPPVPKPALKSPTSPKTPPDIPQKAKWSPGGTTPPAIGSKPSPVGNKTPTSPVNANIPWKKPHVTPVKKDINDNDKNEPRSDSTASNKRASVSDMMKNFQHNTNIEKKEPKVAPKVSPLKSSNNVNTSTEIKEGKLETKTTDLPSKSVADRIAVFKKTDSNNSENTVTLRNKAPLRAAKPTVTKKSVIRRKSDNKSFKTVNQIQSPGPAPTKPPKLTDIDLKNIKEEFKEHLSKFGDVERASNAGIDDEVYDDCESAAKEKERPVSLIPDMDSDEEENYDDIGNTKIDDPTPDETYDDCGNTAAITEELYEPLDEIDEGGSQVDEKDVLERKKREEKERKEQEKKEKDERRKKEKEEKDKQKELKKKEKEEKDRMNKLKATGTETKVGDGVIKENCKGGKLDLALKSGDQVVIMRMQNNPKGKWLVTSTDGKWGYVDSGNVEMMNGEEFYMEADDVEGATDDVVYEEL